MVVQQTWIETACAVAKNLENWGWNILAMRVNGYGDFIVFCQHEDMTTPEPYVSWKCGSDGARYYGHYFPADQRDKAERDYQLR